MKELVVALYRGQSWDDSLRLARELLPSAGDARGAVETLTLEPGWRERTVAARIVAAFQLRDLALPLIATFAEAPEFYTAGAMSKMLATLGGAEAELGLTQMRQSCPDSAYGATLLGAIDKT